MERSKSETANVTKKERILKGSSELDQGPLNNLNEKPLSSDEITNSLNNKIDEGGNEDESEDVPEKFHFFRKECPVQEGDKPIITIKLSKDGRFHMNY